MKVNIDIDTKTLVRFCLVILGIVVAVYLFMLAQNAFVILGTSAFLALALNVPVSAVTRRFPSRSRLFAAAAAYIAIVAFLAAVVFLVIPPIVQQTAKFAQTIPTIIQDTTTKWQALGDFIKQYNLQPQIDAAMNSIQDNATSWAGDVGSNIMSGIGSVFGFFTSLLLVLVLTFLMLIEGPSWKLRFFNLYSDEKKMRKHKAVIKKLQDVFTGYVTGQLTVSSIGAVFAGLAVFAISFIFPAVPSSLAMPAVAITFLLSLIPLFGAMIGGLLITALLLFNSPPAAISYLIYFIVYQQIENNFISPHIQSKKLNLSALLVLGSVTIGIYMFGLVGGIIAIPIAGSARVLIDEYMKDAAEARRHHKKA
jgi:predicted PurR-regulated permease PerM